MIKDFILKLWIWRTFLLHKNTLPTASRIENPEMKYEVFSGAFYWDDEGLWEAHYHLADAFKSVIHQRMKLLVGPNNDVGVFRSHKFDKQIYNMAKKYFPNWIGFDTSRCSYNPEIADRIMRIKRVENWRYQKLMNEEN